MERSGRGTWLARRAIVALALALVLVGVVALSAEARRRGTEGRAPSPERLAARMAERLGLSAEQTARIQEILTQNAAQRTEIREEGRRKMLSLREETEKRFAAVLTPEQMEKLRTLREERRDRRRDCAPRHGSGDAGNPGGPPPEHD